MDIVENDEVRDKLSAVYKEMSVRQKSRDSENLVLDVLNNHPNENLTAREIQEELTNDYQEISTQRVLASLMSLKRKGLVEYLEMYDSIERTTTRHWSLF